MLSMAIFNNHYSEESFFSFLMLLVQRGSTAPAFVLEVTWLGEAPRPRGTGRLAHSPSSAVLLSHGRCQAAQLSRVDSCLPPLLLSPLQSGLLRLPDLTLPVCKEQRVELGLQSCKVVPSREGWKERPPPTDPEQGNETARPKC